MEILGLSGGGLARSFVGGTPGRQILRDSLKRKCDILVSPGPEVILENLGLSGGGLGLDRPRRSYCDYSSSFFQTWAALAHDSSRLDIHQWPKHNIKVTSTLTKSYKGCM